MLMWWLLVNKDTNRVLRLVHVCKLLNFNLNSFVGQSYTLFHWVFE